MYEILNHRYRPYNNSYYKRDFVSVHSGTSLLGEKVRLGMTFVLEIIMFSLSVYPFMSNCLFLRGQNNNVESNE